MAQNMDKNSKYVSCKNGWLDDCTFKILFQVYRTNICMKGDIQLLQVVTWIDSHNGGHLTSAQKRSQKWVLLRGHDLKNLVDYDFHIVL